MKSKSSALAIPLKEAETIRQDLRKKGLLRDDLKIIRDDTFVYLPVIDQRPSLQHYQVIQKEFENKEKNPASYKELMDLPSSVSEILPTSYDIIGDIIVIKLPRELLKYKKKIGTALLQTHPHIKTVCLANPVTGELRTRKVSIIAGEPRTMTIHREYGLLFDVDVKTTYFSPRLSSERQRVTSLVRPRETVVDLFAGVAPFSIMIARYAQPKIVYAIDKNKKAVDLARQNVIKNHVLDRVEVLHADAHDIPKMLPVQADRIIMNLPFSAYQFFPTALKIAQKTCIIHYYDILKEDEIEKRSILLKKKAEQHHFSLPHLDIRRIKTYAPREFYIGIDITATKHADVA